MPPEPQYNTNINPVHHLQYAWTGWPAKGHLPPLPVGPARQALESAWNDDGLRLLEHTVPGDRLHMTFGVRPDVSPEFFVARVKGRLQHGYRQSGSQVKFSRKVAFRGIGDNTRATVENYVRDQLNRADLADPRYRESMKQHHYRDSACRLDHPRATERGRYWYNLHLVLVVAGRHRVGSDDTPRRIRETCLGTARKHDCEISELSIMPDHIHIALKGDPAESPATIALAFMDNTAYRLGLRFWEDRYFVGTFGEYTMQAVRGL